jgi:MFS family permease
MRAKRIAHASHKEGTMATHTQPGRLSLDFWKFWGGQTISNLGSSVTVFALPLLTYKLTGSAVNLALSPAATFLPYLLFGLVIGAWVDRLDRKRLMISVDLLQALVIASIPLADALGALSVWWIYAAGFISSTLTIGFHAAEFAAIPSLVSQSDLVTANGRIQASYSAASVIGPILAGALVAFLPLSTLLLIDAASFLVSAVMLAMIARRFNSAERAERSSSMRADIAEGLRYVLGHPVLRNISIMMALVNFFGSTVQAQLVLFAYQRLGATDSQIGWLYAAGSAGVIGVSLLAGPLRRRFSFSRVALGALMVSGLLQIVLASLTSLPLALVVWALAFGTGILFNINTSSLRQAIVPNALLGRVLTIAGVIAWSAIPAGAFLGGWLIERTGQTAAIFAGVGVITTLIPVVFLFTPLGRAEQYLPREAEQPEIIAAGEAGV